MILQEWFLWLLLVAIISATIFYRYQQKVTLLHETESVRAVYKAIKKQWIDDCTQFSDEPYENLDDLRDDLQWHTPLNSVADATDWRFTLGVAPNKRLGVMEIHYDDSALARSIADTLQSEGLFKLKADTTTGMLLFYYFDLWQTIPILTEDSPHHYADYLSLNTHIVQYGNC